TGQREDAGRCSNKEILEVMWIASDELPRALRGTNERSDLCEIGSGQCADDELQMFARMLGLLRHEQMKMWMFGREPDEVFLHQPELGHLVDAAKTGQPPVELVQKGPAGRGQHRPPKPFLVGEVIVDEWMLPARKFCEGARRRAAESVRTEFDQRGCDDPLARIECAALGPTSATGRDG